MAFTRSPSTPSTQVMRVAVSTPSPGTWRHPKFDEIARRQNAATFSDSNLRKLKWNAGALAVLWLVGNLIESQYGCPISIPECSSQRQSPDIRNAILTQPLQYYTQTFLNILSLLSLFNIVISLYPLVMKKDNLDDIALTPSQRALLGLDPNATPPVTPTTQYITPPRYPRTSTPRTRSPGSRSGSNSGSPLSWKPSPSPGPPRSESPFSPPAIPIWQKNFGDSRDATRRRSYGSPSPLGDLGRGWKDSSVLGAPSTPSPSAGRGSSVPLNNRWLYERGKITPGSRMPKIFA